MQNQTVFAVTAIGAADETAGPYLGTHLNPRNRRLQCLATGNDVDAAYGIPLVPGNLLAGAMVQRETGYGNASRATPYLRHAADMPRYHQPIVQTDIPLIAEL